MNFKQFLNSWILLNFKKYTLNFILKFSTLNLSEKLQSHFFTGTETLNSDKSDSNQCYSVILNFTECYQYLKIHEFYWILNVQVLNSQSMMGRNQWSWGAFSRAKLGHDGLRGGNSGTIRYDTRCYFNVRSKADISQLNLPHGTDN